MKLIYILIFSALIFSACRKSERDKDTEVQSSKDFAKSLKIFLNVFRTADYYSKNTSGVFRMNSTQSGCDSVWVDTLSNPKRIIINFGTAGCSAFDGVVKKGKMIISYTSRYGAINDVATITLDNFYVYDEKVTGSVNIINTTDTASSADPNYSLNITGGKIKADDKYLEFSATLKLKTSAGKATAASSDDQFKITGTFTGRSYTNNTYSCKTISDLEYAYSCNYPTAGRLELTPANLAVRTLDFGSGCDEKFNVSLFYNAYEESIP